MSVVLSAAAVSVVHAQAIVPAEVILSEGSSPSWAEGLTVSTVNTAYTSEDGKVGFLAVLSDSRRVIFFDTGPVFFSTPSQTGGEGSIGVASGGRFVYSPSIDGNDGIWGSSGYIISDGDEAPGYPGLYISFASRPSMFGDGLFAFVGGLASTPTGSTAARVLYRGQIGDPVLTPVYRTGDTIDGRTLRFATPGMSFNYDFSDNGQHVIHIVDVGGATGSAAVLYNGSIIAEDGQPLPGDPDEGWENFSGVGVNNDGDTLIWGDFITASQTDNFIAVNRVPAVREGDTVDGITIPSGSTVRAASISNIGTAAYIWSFSTTNRVLFHGNIADLRGTSIKVVRIGDLLDLDGDGIGDLTVRDLPETTTTTSAMDLGDDGYLYTSITVSDIGQTATRKIIAKFCPGCSTACPPCPADFNQDGGVDGSDVEAFYVVWESGEGCGDVNEDGGVDGGDVETFFARWEAGGC
ncbi:MAG: hypothetical protein JNK25_14870 [Phycisphaerae bacterium]|nr:hypothetical protein [Phycisphaerae bacterium]